MLPGTPTVPERVAVPNNDGKAVAATAFSVHALHPGWPVGHAQTPPTQDCAEEQATLHAPQFALFVARSTHVPPQHNVSAAQTLPQAPQLSPSVVVLMHALPQRLDVNP
jgi:hypothetical protein